MNHFRSPLMQQLAASARNQSSPPLALGSVSRGLNSLSTRRSSTRCESSSSSTIQSAPSIPLSVRNSSTAHPDASRVPVHSTKNDSHEESEDGISLEAQRKATALQELIKSRRTVSHFLPYFAQHTDVPIQDAVRRAVECAMYAPNHKRTEPFTFKQMFAPSDATHRLKRISYNVTLHRALNSRRMSEDEARIRAEQKSEKWGRIPAFLVALVSGQPPQRSGLDVADDNDLLFHEHPTVPPVSHRQLEDYAATCAAIQNILLSLHAEGLGAKWATGPIVRTTAFRDLVHAKDDELIVGLLMIGATSMQPKPVRKRRCLDGDVLQSL